MRVQNYWFWQGWVIIKNSALVDLVSRTIFVPKLAAILDFEPLGDQETIFNQLYHIFHPQKHMFRDEVCGSVIIKSWGMEYIPFSAFRIFFVAAILKMLQEREHITNFSF